MKYPICNHREDTAPRIFGQPFLLCWRCTGVMISFIVMVVVRDFVNISFGVFEVISGVLLMLPMIFDGYIQYFLKHESTNLRRSVTGILFGIGFSLVVFIFESMKKSL